MRTVTVVVSDKGIVSVKSEGCQDFVDTVQVLHAAISIVHADMQKKAQVKIVPPIPGLGNH